MGKHFRWYNGSVELTFGGRIEITYTEISGDFPWQTTLTISDVQQEDLGNYTCEGFNALGRTYTAIELTVKSAYFIRILISYSNLILVLLYHYILFSVIFTSFNCSKFM